MDKNKAHKIAEKIIAKSWKDPEFKKKLLANPKAALAELGYQLPDDVTVKVHEDTQKTLNLILPSAPGDLRELSPDEMGKLTAGGKSSTFSYPC